MPEADRRDDTPSVVVDQAVFNSQARLEGVGVNLGNLITAGNTLAVPIVFEVGIGGSSDDTQGVIGTDWRVIEGATED